MAHLMTNIFGTVITNVSTSLLYIAVEAGTDNYTVDELCLLSSRTLQSPGGFRSHSHASLHLPLSHWSSLKHRVSEAQEILARLMAKPSDDPDVVDQIQNLVATVEHEAEVQQSVPLKEIFTRNNKQRTLRRMLLSAGTAFFQQVGSTKVIAYYLPVVLTRSVGLSARTSFIFSVCDFMSLMFWGSVAAFLIDRLCRKRLMLMGVAASSV